MELKICFLPWPHFLDRINSEYQTRRNKPIDILGNLGLIYENFLWSINCRFDGHWPLVSLYFNVS